MIQFIVADITSVKAEAIVNAANGIGIMGAGVAGAISEAGGDIIQKEARGIYKDNGKPISSGCCYRTGSGNLLNNGIKYIYHAVTMEFPGSATSLDIVSKCFRATLDQVLIDGVKSLAVPALGTGIGHLDRSAVATIMVNIAEKYANCLEIYFVDIDKKFIDEARIVFEKGKT